MARLSISLLGKAQINLDGETVAIGRNRGLALLAYVALAHSPVSRTTLASLLWADYSPKQASAYLRQTLWALQKDIGKAWLNVSIDSVKLDSETDIWIDVLEYQRLQQLAESARQVADPLPKLLEAADLYRGNFLQGFGLPDCPEFDQWQLLETETLQQTQMTLLSKTVELLSQRLDFDLAIQVAQRLLAMDTLNEVAHRQLMKLYSASGQTGLAIRQFQACSKILNKELGVPPTDTTVHLYEAITKSRQQPSTIATPGAVSTLRQLTTSEQIGSLIPVHSTPHMAIPKEVPLTQTAEQVHSNLPPSITPFIGRDTELQQVVALLMQEDCRLVTLIGNGGIGKTRLAVASAQAIRVRFCDGVYFVPLADVVDAERMVTAIASVLKFALYRREEEPLQQLLTFLQNKRMLLVLDNFEHLLAGASLVTTLLNAAPEVKVLATSRQRLQLEGEWLFEVEGLRFPNGLQSVTSTSPAANAPTLAEIAQLASEYSALELFVRSAQRLNWSFRLEQANLAAVIRICQLVEGMPLALELSASWIRLLSVQEIVIEIQKSIAILRSSQQSLPERHRSILAVFNYSWLLLSEEERETVQKLSVFRGGFRREAAQLVTNASLPLLLALSDKSLLRNDGEDRFSMHELLRQFATEKLATTPEKLTDVGRQHADYFVKMLAGSNAELHGKQQKRVLAVLVADIENIRDSWRWIVQERQEAAIDSVYDPLATIFELCGWLHEGRSIFAEAVTQIQSADSETGAPTPAAVSQVSNLQIEGKLLSRLAFFSHRLGKYAQAKAQFERSYQLLLASNAASALPFSEIAYCLNNLGDIARIEGEYEKAQKLLAESVELCKTQRIQNRLVRALNTLGIVCGTRGDHELAKQHFRQSLKIGEAIEDQLGIAKAINNLGILAYFAEDYPTATYFYRRSLTISQDLGHHYDAALALSNLGMAMQKQGDYKNAIQMLRESAAILRRIGYEMGVGLTLVGLAAALLEVGNRQDAGNHYLEVLQLAKKIQSTPLTLAAIAGIASVYESMHKLKEAVTLATLVDSHPACDDETRSKALHTLEMIRSYDPSISAALLPDSTPDETLTQLVEILLVSGVTPSLLSSFSSSLPTYFKLQLNSAAVAI